ncbi:MAG: hypothetical protein IJU23_12770 [Proteobacteria bacterium]|nr:hypothetical protein [Pseudomonadota bacterium]
MKRIVLSILMILLVCLAGCNSDRAKLEKICSDVEAVSLMTNDCSEMGAKLEPVTTNFMATVNRIATEVPDVETRKSYVDVTSRCLRGYMKIELGTCGDNEMVKAALPKREFTLKK